MIKPPTLTLTRARFEALGELRRAFEQASEQFEIKRASIALIDLLMTGDDSLEARYRDQFMEQDIETAARIRDIEKWKEDAAEAKRVSDRLEKGMTYSKAKEK